MSSWDRQAALKKYRTLFSAAPDTEALIAQLGTPTKLAIDLAAVYVPTAAPSVLAEALLKCPVALEDLLRDPRALAADLAEETRRETDAPQPETWVFPAAEPAPAPEPEDTEPEPQPARTGIRTGALLAYLLPAVVIGLPVAVLLVCIGLPFILGGAGIACAAVYAALQVFGQLRLVADVLLTAGAALVAAAVGVLLFWFGLWLSSELCWLWVGKGVVGLGKRLCVRKEAAG